MCRKTKTPVRGPTLGDSVRFWGRKSESILLNLIPQSFLWGSTVKGSLIHPTVTGKIGNRTSMITGNVVCRISFATQRFCYRGPKPQKCPKWLGEGAKGVLGQGRQRPLALVQKRVAPVQNRILVVQKTLGRPLLPGSKTPFAPSPNHFGHF